MRTFRAKQTPLYLFSVVCLLVGLIATWQALDAGLSDSFWGSIQTSRRSYSVPLLLGSGLIMSLVGAAAGSMAADDNRRLTIGSGGIRQAPGMAKPVSWDKIGRIEQLESNRSRYMRKGWIILTVPNRSDIERAGWLWRVLAWSPSSEGTIVIAPSGYENGDEIRRAIERYRSVQ